MSWRNLPVPEGPDKHTDSFCAMETIAEGLKIIGARARGKIHKHYGTNCDDWFEFARAGNWTIIAVSDGAGSASFSRIGAKWACRIAVKQLCQLLKNHSLQARTEWSDEDFRRDETTGAYITADIEKVQNSLFWATWAAYGAVEALAEDLADSSEHEAVLNRKVQINDLASTLLLAVHTTIKREDGDYSFVMACQIGDGITAVVDQKGDLSLLGLPDRGEYAGQTEFLVNKKNLEEMNFSQRTFHFFNPMRALMVMTDGVSDIYFPNDPGMLNLYGDLVINHLIEHEVTGRRASASTASEQNSLNSSSNIAFTESNHSEDATSSIRSIGDYANKLDIDIRSIIASPELMRAAIGDEPFNTNGSPAERLCAWLDSYEVRGERDDRTLVVISG